MEEVPRTRLIPPLTPSVLITTPVGVVGPSTVREEQVSLGTDSLRSNPQDGTTRVDILTPIYWCEVNLR